MRLSTGLSSEKSKPEENTDKKRMPGEVAKARNGGLKMRLIDADALVAELKWLQSQVSSASAIEIQEYIDRTNRQPTIEAAPVVHGR